MKDYIDLDPYQFRSEYRFQYSREYNCLSVLLLEFGLPNVRYHENGIFIDESTGKQRFAQKSGILEIKSTWTNKIEKIRPERVHNYYFRSPWAYDSCEYMYRHLDFLDLPGYYVVENGDVYSLHTNTYMTGVIDKGYLTLCLTNKLGKQVYPRVHRLVAMAFIPNPENKPEVDHIDGNKLNNYLENLRWAWPYENISYAREKGLRPKSLTDEQIHRICQLLENGYKTKDIAQMLNISRGLIQNIKSGDHYHISKDYNIPRIKNTRREYSILYGPVDTGY